MNSILKTYLISSVAVAVFFGGFVVFQGVLAQETSDTSVSVGNAAPTVSSVDLNGGSAIVLSENTSTTIQVSATISDDNGCEDVKSPTGTVSAVVYRSGVGATCSADDQNCYTGITLSEVSSDTCDGGGDTTYNASGTVGIWWFAQPTDASSTFSGETWQTQVKAVDGSNASSTATDASPPELNTLTALSVDATISYGSLAAGATSTLSSIDQSTTTINNTGNASIDTDISGTDMSDGGNTIAANNQKFATSSVGYESLSYTLSTSAQTIDISIPAAASQASSTDDSFWGISIPGGQGTGSYTGTNTFSATWSAD